MRKLEIYVETSVWNAPFSIQSPEFRIFGNTFFEKADEYSLFVSSLVLAEIRRCPEPKIEKLTGLLEQHKPTELEIDTDVEILSKKYIDYGIIPAKFIADAQHIAVASINDLDYIVSLNFAHIVREKTRDGITGVNAVIGYRSPKIISPAEL